MLLLGAGKQCKLLEVGEPVFGKSRLEELTVLLDYQEYRLRCFAYAFGIGREALVKNKEHQSIKR